MKTFHRLHLVIFVSVFVFCGCSLLEKTVTEDQLQDRNGVKFLPNMEVGFTGKLLEYHEGSDQKKAEGRYEDGLKEGLWVHWHENGQKSYEWNYVNGKLEGLSTGWNENGQKEYESNYVNGKRVGGSLWMENGKKVY